MKKFICALNNDSHVLACCLQRKIDLITVIELEFLMISLDFSVVLLVF